MKQVPLPAKIVIFFYLFLPSILAILGGIATFLIGDIGPVGYLPVDFIEDFLGGFGYILIGVLLFFFARGLWRGRKWARILFIIYTAIILIEILIGSMQGRSISWYSLILNLVILLYFILNKEIKSVYTK